MQFKHDTFLHLSRVKLMEIILVRTLISFMLTFNTLLHHVSHCLIFKSQCRQIIGTSAGASVATDSESSRVVHGREIQGPLLRTRATRRSIKNIVFNLARRVLRAYTRFHNYAHARIHTFTRVAISCVRARCRFHDAAPVASLLFPGSSINWSGKISPRERARIAYHPRASTRMRLCRVYLRLPILPSRKSLLVKKAFSSEF